MLGSTRPSKRSSSSSSVPKHHFTVCRKESKLEDVVASLNLRGQVKADANDTFRPSQLPRQAIDQSKLLRLNVGGASYRFKTSTVIQRCEKSLLYRFVFLSHESRLALADGWLEDTQEYFFERSAQLFDPIYQYYITGICHKPKHVCVDIFVSELIFWNIRKALFAQCCWPEPKTEENGDVKRLSKHQDEFAHLRFGKMRRIVWNLIEVPESSIAARTFAIFSIVAVLLSIAIMIVSSIPEFQVERNFTYSAGTNGSRIVTKIEPHPVLKNMEYCCIAWFSTEYLSKMLVAANRRHAFCQILNIIDLVAIVPFYFELTLELSGVDTSSLGELNGALLMIRILRVSRVIRIFKLGRYSSGLRAFARTLKASTKQLSMLGVVLTTGVMFFSTLVYSLEKDVEGTDFHSIPAAFWWCIVTMTTVGYGDMVPETVAGKLVGSGAIACGVLVLALPITIIVDNFMKVHESDSENPMVNPFRRRQNDSDESSSSEM